MYARTATSNTGIAANREARASSGSGSPEAVVKDAI
jgi:hypothetical protein